MNGNNVFEHILQALFICIIKIIEIWKAANWKKSLTIRRYVHLLHMYITFSLLTMNNFHDVGYFFSFSCLTRLDSSVHLVAPVYVYLPKISKYKKILEYFAKKYTWVLFKLSIWVKCIIYYNTVKYSKELSNTLCYMH